MKMTTAEDLMEKSVLASDASSDKPEVPGMLLSQLGLTWHDDVREAQFAADGHAPAENERVLPAHLLHVAPQQLQRDDETCNRK